jgi:hypothetical protein
VRAVGGLNRKRRRTGNDFTKKSVISTPWQNHHAKIKPRTLTGAAYEICLQQSDLETVGGRLGDRIGGVKNPELPRTLS